MHKLLINTVAILTLVFSTCLVIAKNNIFKPGVFGYTHLDAKVIEKRISILQKTKKIIEREIENLNDSIEQLSNFVSETNKLMDSLDEVRVRFNQYSDKNPKLSERIKDKKNSIRLAKVRINLLLRSLEERREGQAIIESDFKVGDFILFEKFYEIGEVVEVLPKGYLKVKFSYQILYSRFFPAVSTINSTKIIKSKDCIKHENFKGVETARPLVLVAHKSMNKKIGQVLFNFGGTVNKTVITTDLTDNSKSLEFLSSSFLSVEEPNHPVFKKGSRVLVKLCSHEKFTAKILNVFVYHGRTYVFVRFELDNNEQKTDIISADCLTVIP